MEFRNKITDLDFDVLCWNFRSIVLFEKKEKTKSGKYHLQKSDKEWRYGFYIWKVIFHSATCRCGPATEYLRDELKSKACNKIVLCEFCHSKSPYRDNPHWRKATAQGNLFYCMCGLRDKWNKKVKLQTIFSGCYLNCK